MSQKQVALIGAIARNGMYGYGRGAEGTIPWKSGQDMKFFRETTMGHTICISRGTWESIPSKYRPFVGRTNFIVTSNSEFQISQEDVSKGVKVFGSMPMAIESAPTEKVFIIGGSDIWRSAMPYVHKLYVNHIGLEPEIRDNSVFFNELLDPLSHFEGFIPGGDPQFLTDNKGTPQEFLVSCFCYMRK